VPGAHSSRFVMIAVAIIVIAGLLVAMMAPGMAVSPN
jgi:hypothetical protein